MNQVTQRISPAPEYAAGWLVGQLPVGMRDDDLLVRFTTIFEWLGATLRAGADGIEHAADTAVTTPGMLRYLGTWLGYDLLEPGMPIARQREIITAIGHALPRRATAAGLCTLLQALTDAPVRIEEPGAVVRDGQAPPVRGEVVVHVANTGHLRADEFEQLVRDEVPAHLGLRLVVGEAREGDAVDPTPGDDPGLDADAGSGENGHVTAGATDDVPAVDAHTDPGPANDGSANDDPPGDAPDELAPDDAPEDPR